jgi:thioredoxin-related protein
MKKILIASTFALLTVGLMATRTAPRKTTAVAKIQWLSIGEAYKLSQKEPRKFVIDVYTEWCGWCKVMDQKTFTNAQVIDFVGKKYYAVKYNPETEGDVMLGKTSFRSLLQGINGYPTTVLLDEKYGMIQPISGYLEARIFHQVVTFFGDDNHKKEDFEKFKTGTYATKYNSNQ